MLRDVIPKLPFHDLPSCSSIYSKGSANLGVCLSRLLHASYGHYLNLGEFCVAMRFSTANPFRFCVCSVLKPFRCATLLRHIRRIFGMCPEKKVIWPNAIPNIAFVTNAHTIGYRAEVDAPRNAMHQQHGSGWSPRLDLTIATGKRVSGPQPARICFRDHLPKALLNWNVCKTTLSLYNWVRCGIVVRGSGHIHSMIDCLANAVRTNGRRLRFPVCQIIGKGQYKA